MSNPRNQVFHDELDYHATTFKGDGSILFIQVPTYGQNHSAQIGLSCTLTGSKQVGLGANGNALFGRIRSVEADLNVAVQDEGYMQLAYPVNDATAPVVGSPVACDGTGKVVKAASGNNIVESVDTAGLTCIVQRL